MAGRAVTRAAASGALAVLAARAGYAGLRRYPPAGEKTWTRTNHRGELVTLVEGPALAVGAVAAQVAVGRRGDVTSAVAGLGALGFGLLDDLRGSGQRRGLRGHLGALAQGEVTTGTVKLAGLAATGVGAALAEGGSAVDVALNAGLIAGGANLLNLFDLRPGRAIKVGALAAGLAAAGGAIVPGDAGRLVGLETVAAPAGAALALLPEDLGERAMLGDAGANALGALLGVAAARALPRRGRLGALAVVVTLTLVSEKVSFTKVIERTPTLHKLDMLGRRPVPLAAPVAPVAPVAGAPARLGSAQRWWGRRPGRHRRNHAGVSRTP